MIPTLVAWAINTNIDKFMIISLCGLGESGIYGVAHKIPTLMTTVLSVFTQAWLLSAINNYGDSDESEYYTNVYKALNIVSVLGCFAIIFMTKFMSELLFAKIVILHGCIAFLDGFCSLLFKGGVHFICIFKAAKKRIVFLYCI
jgi:O-antigen/teichoic acid export membrane protein